MFKEFDDGSYSQFLLTYTNCSFNEDGVIICDNNDLIIESINDTGLFFSRGCGPEFIDVTTENVCYGIGCNGGGNHMPGDDGFNNCICRTDANCNVGYDYCYDRDIFHFSDCSGGTYTTTNSDGSPNTGGQGGGSTTNPPPPNTTIGVPFSLYEFLAEECLNSGYNPNNLNNTVVPIDLSNFNLTPEQVQDIFNYLNIENGCSDEAKEFVRLALEAIDEGGEVDFDDELVIDESFKNNPKANCVYNKMKQINNTLFTGIMDSFDGNREVRLKLKVEDIPMIGGISQNGKTLPRASGPNFNRTFDIILDPDFVENASLIEIAIVIIHESIHAEIMERCIQLGIITEITYDNNWLVHMTFGNGEIISSDFQNTLFALLVDNYSEYNGGSQNLNWQHDLFDVSGYRSRVSEDLSIFHQVLDDSLDPFINNLNNGTEIDVSMAEYFELYSWLGLFGTEAYNNLTPLELTKLSQIINQTNQFYNDDCN